MKRHYRKSIVLLLTCLLLTFAATLTGMADNTRHLRVGYYPLPNFHSENDAGEVVGYERDYLDYMTEIHDWSYEYIKADSWEQAVQMLENHEIDVLAPAQIIEDRADRFAFTAMPLGYTSGAVFVDSSHPGYYEDFDTLASMTYGVERGVSYKSLYETYAMKHGFTPHIRIYENHTDLVEALSRGEVDAALANIMRIDPKHKILAKFGATSYYFMLRPDDSDLLERLNATIFHLDRVDPEFRQNLLNQYFPFHSRQPLTMEEQLFVEQLPTLKVGCAPYLDPLVYKEKNTGELAGITPALLDVVAEHTGLRFEYVELPEGPITYEELRAVDVDLISCVEYNHTNAGIHGIRLTDPYMSARKVMVGISGQRYDLSKPQRIGVVSGSATVEKVIHLKYPASEVIPFDTLYLALDGIFKGQVDLVLQNEYCIDRVLEQSRYQNLSVIATAGIGDAHSLSPLILKESSDKPDPVLSNPLLISVLNKGIMSITNETRSLIIMNQTITRHYRLTVWDFLYQYRYFLLVLGTVTLICLILVWRVYQIRKRMIAVLIENARILEEQKEVLRLQSQLDPLTGLYNKSVFRQQCCSYLQGNPDSPCLLLFADMDNFKQVNDQISHLAGDQVLQQVASILREFFQEDAILARFGGDEFCVLLKDTTEQEQKDRLLELLNLLGFSYRAEDGQTFPVTISIGVAERRGTDGDLDTLLGQADQALYQAKRNGKSRYATYHS